MAKATGQCERCGGPAFGPRGPRKFCQFCKKNGRSSGPRPAHRLAHPKGQTCPQCGKNFMAKHGRVYCSVKCRAKTNRGRAPLVSLTCSHCGKDYEAKAKPKARPYCSDGCIAEARRWQRLKVRSVPVPWDECGCGRMFISLRNGRCRLCHEAGLLVVRLYGRRCVVCGDHYESNQPTQQFCSRRCRRRWHRRLMRERHGRHDTHRKRARRYGVEYEPVNKRKVFKRDDYRCGICGRKTLKDARVPHHHAPTIDHIIPLSQGGDHVYENVQCACFICNTRKGVHGANDQLLLVG